MTDFEKWWKENWEAHLGLDQRWLARSPWDFQQKKIDQLERDLKEMRAELEALRGENQ